MDPQPLERIFADSRATVDQMGEGSFPASDPPAVWTWDVGRAADEEPERAVGKSDDHSRSD